MTVSQLVEMGELPAVGSAAWVYLDGPGASPTRCFIKDVSVRVDRGEPVVQVSPPLIATQQHFDEIESILRTVLSRASEML